MALSLDERVQSSTDVLLVPSLLVAMFCCQASLFAELLVLH